MLGLDISEILLILAVAFIALGPKELPTVVRYIAAFIREFQALTSGARAQFHEVIREAGLDDVMNKTTTIIDLEGKPQKAYDVRDIKKLEAPKPDHD